MFHKKDTKINGFEIDFQYFLGKIHTFLRFATLVFINWENTLFFCFLACFLRSLL